MLDDLRRHGTLTVRYVRQGDNIGPTETVETTGSHHGAHAAVAWGHERPVTMREIQLAVCARYGVTMEELLGPCRTHGLVLARSEAMAAARAVGRWSYPEIGRAFRRHHATVVHAVRKWGVA